MVILWLLGLVWLVVGGWGVLSTYRVLHPKARVFPVPSPLPELTTVSLTSRDGTPFEIWVLQALASRGVVVACHGYHANRFQILDTADRLRRLGYTVILLELRGHGNRPGSCTLGVKEVLDIGAIREWLKQQPSLAPLPVGMYGLSLGGVIACQAAARDPGIAAVAADSAYARLFPILAYTIKRDYHLPSLPWTWITWAGLHLALRCRMSRWDPAVVASRVRQPALLIHGAEDQTVPLAHAQELYDRWHGPKEQWIQPQAGHARTSAADPQGYAQRVASFFDRWLSSHP